MSKLLTFKWTISRGADTMGYNICSLWVDGKKEASCNGGGYDLQGACFGEYLLKYYEDRLLSVAMMAGSAAVVGPNGWQYMDKGPGELYGLTVKFNADKSVAGIHLDGACGMNSMLGIAGAIGLKMNSVPGGSMKDDSQYILTDTKEK